MTPFTIPIPRYQFCRQVSALKIKAVVPNPRGYELHFEDARFVPMQVSDEWHRRYSLREMQPRLDLAGGYAVWDDSGRMGWMQADSFEVLYKRYALGDATNLQGAIGVINWAGEKPVSGALLVDADGARFVAFPVIKSADLLDLVDAPAEHPAVAADLARYGIDAPEVKP